MFVKRKPVLGCDTTTDPPIHRFQQGVRTCYCGATTVPDPNTKSKGNFGRNVAKQSKR